MIKGDFEFTKVGDNLYEVRHIPTDKVLGRMEKGWRTWDSVPMTEHYSCGETQLETAQAMFSELKEFGVLASPEPAECPYKAFYRCKKCDDDDCPIDS